MSISKLAKEEICKRYSFSKESKHLLQGVFLTAGSLVISNGELSFVLSNENEDVIEFIKKQLQSLFDGIVIDIVKVVKNFKNKERFELSVVGDFNQKVLTELGIISKSDDGEVLISDVCDKSFMKNQNTMTAFLIGVFLGDGTISVPSQVDGKRRYGYHFEIDFTSKNQADIVAEIMSNFDIFPKIVERNEQYVLYLKNSDVICDILGLLGASKVVLNVMNDRVSRDMNNMTNRQINCISANIDKAVNAGIRQLEAIEIIRSTIGIENLPEPLSEACLSRLANPEGSLGDLIQTLDGKITKSALAQRFKKILKIAEELGENNDK